MFYLFPPSLSHSTVLQTEKDFAEIAGAGLNFVRIPIPYWVIEVRDNEPFLGGTAWKCVNDFYIYNQVA